MTTADPCAGGLVPRSIDRHSAPITRTQIVRFAGAGGDFNPMHHDEPFAQSAGQPSVFAMGQMLAAILGSFARDWVGQAAMISLAVRFTAKVWPGDELALHGEVSEAFTGKDGRARCRCALTAIRAGDEVAARAELIVPAATFQANDG